jgi:lipoyl(octanoyl) transferase
VAEHRLMIDPPAPGAWNMAVDEAMLMDAAETGVATLRFYQWSKPTLSLGYFQAYDDRRQHAASLECACVRRQTGGGAIVHDREITYSIVLPPDHPHARHSSQLYAKVHDAFIQTLINSPRDAHTVPVALQRLSKVSNSKPAAEPFLCFERRAIGDVILTPQRRAHGSASESGDNDWKILGSAQRRSRGALLQHGSLLLQKSTAAPELLGFHDAAGADVQGMPEAVIPRLEEAMGVRFTSQNIPRSVELNARQLANSKYGTAAWTKRR